jgi:hypothetical protein
MASGVKVSESWLQARGHNDCGVQGRSPKQFAMGIFSSLLT